MSNITNDQLNSVWHRMLYSCTHMTTVGVKWLILSCLLETVLTHLLKFVSR